MNAAPIFTAVPSPQPLLALDRSQRNFANEISAFRTVKSSIDVAGYDTLADAEEERNQQLSSTSNSRTSTEDNASVTGPYRTLPLN